MKKAILVLLAVVVLAALCEAHWWGRKGSHKRFKNKGQEWRKRFCRRHCCKFADQCDQCSSGGSSTTQQQSCPTCSTCEPCPTTAAPPDPVCTIPDLPPGITCDNNLIDLQRCLITAARDNSGSGTTPDIRPMLTCLKPEFDQLQDQLEAAGANQTIATKTELSSPFQAYYWSVQYLLISPVAGLTNLASLSTADQASAAVFLDQIRQVFFASIPTANANFTQVINELVSLSGGGDPGFLTSTVNTVPRDATLAGACDADAAEVNACLLDRIVANAGIDVPNAFAQCIGQVSYLRDIISSVRVYLDACPGVTAVEDVNTYVSTNSANLQSAFDFAGLFAFSSTGQVNIISLLNEITVRLSASLSTVNFLNFLYDSA